MDSDDKKITQLARVTSLSDSDLFVVVVNVGTAPVTKAIEKSNLYNPLKDGWIELSESWTYASASTINVPTDATTRFQKWMKIRFKQGGNYKYYIAHTIAATLLTVCVNTDYTVANSAITNIAISFIEEPYGFPAYFSTADTVMSNVTVGNGDFVSIYSIKGNLFKADISLVWAAAAPTSSISGQIKYTPPVPVPSNLKNYTTVGAGAVIDAETALYMGACIIKASVIELRVINAAGTYAIWTATSGTVPITHGVKDSFTMSIEFLLD